jgi:putative ABC transport system ATP-binding protein
MTTVVQAQRLEKTYRAGGVDVLAVRGVDFAIDTGAFVAFVGPSGSGKTTLLNMIGCLDKPSAGSLRVLDTDIATLDRSAAADFRGANLGFIFQDFNLIPVLTAYENIEYPLLMVQDWPADKRRLDHATAYHILELMKKMRDEFGTTFVFSTHDPKIMGEAELTFTLEDGRLVNNGGARA